MLLDVSSCAHDIQNFKNQSFNFQLVHEKYLFLIYLLMSVRKLSLVPEKDKLLKLFAIKIIIKYETLRKVNWLACGILL